jgi:hypothetical protein
MRLIRINYYMSNLICFLFLVQICCLNCSIWSDLKSLSPFGDDEPILEEGEENDWEIITIVTTFPEEALVKIFAITNFVRDQIELQTLIEDTGLLDKDLQEDYEKQLLQLGKNTSDYEDFYQKAINYFINRTVDEKIVYYQSKGALKPNKNIFFGTDEIAENEISKYNEYYKVHYKKANYEKDNLILKWEFYKDSLIDLCVYFDENRQAMKNVFFTNNKVIKEEYFVALRKWVTKNY